MMSPKVVELDGKRYVTTHKYSTLSKVERYIATFWNKRMTPSIVRNGGCHLRDVVKRCVEENKASKETVVRTWRKFHARYGFGYSIPYWHTAPPTLTPIEQCDAAWLRHHGIGTETELGRGEYLKQIIAACNAQQRP